MSKPPLVSVGMPLFNAERYAAIAIEAILGQTMGDFELVISDNGSTDGTEALCRAYAEKDVRVKFQRNPTNVGVAANFNVVFERSSGKYFKWAAYDDVHLPTYLEKTAAAMEADGDIAVCHCLTTAIDPEGREMGEFAVQYTIDGRTPAERFRKMVWVDAFPPIWGLMRSEMIRRTHLHGPYMGSDRVFMAEMLLQGKMHYVPEKLFLLREHPGSYTSSQKSYYERLRWYAPGARIPSWMQIPNTAWQYTKGVWSVPAPAGQKARCMTTVCGWAAGCMGQWIRGKWSKKAAVAVRASAT